MAAQPETLRVVQVVHDTLRVVVRDTFTFELSEAGPIAIKVFDVAGRKVGGTIREDLPAGQAELGWDAGSLAAGVYHARLTTAGSQAVTRLVRTGVR